MVLGFLFIVRKDKQQAQARGDTAAQAGTHEPLLVDQE
jgi:hypothetical protein